MRQSAIGEADSEFKKSMREAEQIGAAHKEAHEFKSSENDKIKEQQKKMWKILEYKSKENRKKVAYVKSAKTIEEMRQRIKETGIS